MSGAAAGGAAAGGEQSHRNAALVAENVQLQKEIARMRHALGVKDADNARLRADVKMQAETQQQMLKELDQMAVDWRRDVLLSRKVWNAAIAVTRKRKGRVFAGEDVHGAGAARPSSAASQNNQKHRRAAAIDIGPSAHPSPGAGAAACPRQPVLTQPELAALNRPGASWSSQQQLDQVSAHRGGGGGGAGGAGGGGGGGERGVYEQRPPQAVHQQHQHHQQQQQLQQQQKAGGGNSKAVRSRGIQKRSASAGCPHGRVFSKVSSLKAFSTRALLGH